MVNKDLGEIIEALVDQDFTVKVTTKGHYIVRKNGDFVSVFGGTPSDWRGWNNSIAACKKFGFIWPVPKRKRKDDPEADSES